MKINEILFLEGIQQIPQDSKRIKQVASVAKAVLEKNKVKGLKIGKQSRGKLPTALRGDFGSEEQVIKKFNSFKDWQNKPLRFDITPISPGGNGSESNTYTTYIIVPKTNVLVNDKFLKLKPKGPGSKDLAGAIKEIEGEVIWKTGEGVAVVNATAGKTKEGGKKHFKGKDLVPEKFGLAGRVIKTPKFKDEMVSNIEMKFIKKKPQAKALIHIIEQVNKLKGNNIPLDKEILKTIENDVKVVAKDFGEIAGALWFAKEEKAEGISFPAASNEKLVDYAIVKKGVTTRVSAKAGAGGPPSIRVLPDVLEDLQKEPEWRANLSAKEAKAGDLIKKLTQVKVVESILLVNRELDTVAWKEVNKMIGNVQNAERLEDWIREEDQKDREELLKKLNAFYDKVGSRADDPVAILDKAREKKGLIIRPMGAHANKLLNDLPEFDSILNKALRTITVIQVFLDMKVGSLKFTVRPFAEGDFKFDYNGTATLPSNRGFSFRMKKGKAKGVAELPVKESFIDFYFR